MGNKFRELFHRKPIIGMIHLAGNSREDKVKRALDELVIYHEEGLDGAIIEDYHGNYGDIIATLNGTYLLSIKVILGVNVLKDPNSAFELANIYSGVKFAQFDSFHYIDSEKNYSEIVVLGGVGFKYVPETGNPLEYDLKMAKIRGCDAVVTTGPGTGIETPIKKLREYKLLLKEFPLIVGAGLNPRNAYESLTIADGAIVGSYLKFNSDTQKPLDITRIRELMKVVNEARKN